MTGAIIGIIGSVLSWLGNQLSAHFEHRREVEMLKIMQAPEPTPRKLEAIEVGNAEREKIMQAREQTFKHTSKKGGAVAALIVLLVRPVITFTAMGSFFYYLIVFDEYSWPPFAYDVIFFIVTFYFGDRTLRKR